MKSIFQISSLLIFMFLLSTPSKSMICPQKNDPILDSLRYVALPDDNYEGNSYFHKIVSYGETIVPCLIEHITDTTSTEQNPYGVYNYTVSDIVIQILPYMIPNFNFREFIFSEFEIDLDQMPLFELEYAGFFFYNVPEINYKNRIRLYNKIKKWYKEQQKITV